VAAWYLPAWRLLCGHHRSVCAEGAAAAGMMYLVVVLWQRCSWLYHAAWCTPRNAWAILHGSDSCRYPVFLLACAATARALFQPPWQPPCWRCSMIRPSVWRPLRSELAMPTSACGATMKRRFFTAPDPTLPDPSVACCRGMTIAQRLSGVIRCPPCQTLHYYHSCDPPLICLIPRQPHRAAHGDISCR